MKVYLASQPNADPIFVALDHVCRCYPEQGDATWIDPKWRQGKKLPPNYLNLPKLLLILLDKMLLPAHASEQGNVIGSVRIYMCVQKKIVIE